MSKQVLFLCTGNYYRSRFAELLFNHLARRHGIDWQADSRGLAPDFGDWNVGPISAHTLRAIQTLNITAPVTHRDPLHCCETDLNNADLVVAVKEAEHRPLLATHFAGWENRVEYWGVHDLDRATADRALAELEVLVMNLIERLRG